MRAKMIVAASIAGLVSAAGPAAAADCPIAPGRWWGMFHVHLLAMRTDALTTAISATISAKMDLQVSCEGKVMGSITALDDSEFRAIVTAPSPMQERCKLDFEFELKEGTVEKGAGGLPILRIDAHVKGSHPRCTGELRKLIPSHLLMTGAPVRYRFEATGQNTQWALVGGNRPWEMDTNFASWFMPYEPRSSYRTGSEYRWLLMKDEGMQAPQTK